MASFSTSNGDTTVKFEYTAATAKVQAVVGDAAESLWNEVTNDEGVVTNPFSSATNQEKLDVVDAYVKGVVVNLANTFKSRKAQDAARETEAADEHVL